MAIKFIDVAGLAHVFSKIKAEFATNDHTHSASDVGAAPEAFYVTLSGNSADGYTIDKTFAEIMAAYNEGRQVILIEHAYGSIVEYKLQYVYSDEIDFSYHKGINHTVIEVYAHGVVTRKNYQYFSNITPPSYDDVGAEPLGAVHNHNTAEDAHEGMFAPNDHTHDVSDLNGVAEKTAALEFAVAKDVKAKDSAVVIEETNASTSSDDNSAYFNKSYIVANEDTYKLGKEAMLSLPDKKLVGNGSVKWKDWETAPEWGNNTRFTGKLKVDYSDDPIYMSMKLPCEAHHASNAILRGMMNKADNYQPDGYGFAIAIGAVYAPDYTALPETVQICIGNIHMYVLMEGQSSKWTLAGKWPYPLSAALYYIPWPSSGDEKEPINESQIEYFSDHIRYTLPKSAFAPDTSEVAGSTGKVLHFMGKNIEIDCSNIKAAVVMYDIWTETAEADGLLYTDSGLDQRPNLASRPKQLFWGRNHLLHTTKRIVIGHNIFDDVYDELRNTDKDPRFIYADYIAPNSVDCKIKDAIAAIETDINDLTNDVSDLSNKSNSVIEELEILTPGINLNNCTYEAGYFNSAGAEYVGNYGAQSFRTVEYIPVEGGRTIAVYFDKAEWNSNNGGNAVYVIEYDANKAVIGQRNQVNGYMSGSTYALNADTAFIRLGFNKWSNITTALTDIKIAVYYEEDAVTEFVEYGYDAEVTYGVKGEKVTITSPNGTRFVLSVSDDGALSASPLNPS